MADIDVVISCDAGSGVDPPSASGAGPSTAITGTANAHTSGSASTTIEFDDTPDLSGISADDVLYLGTTSGVRKFTRIVSVDDGADTMVVADSFNIAQGSAVDYAIGGTLGSIDNANTRNIFDNNGSTGDVKQGWTLSFITGTAHDITSTLNFRMPTIVFGDPPFRIISATPGTLVSIEGDRANIGFAAHLNWPVASVMYWQDISIESTGTDGVNGMLAFTAGTHKHIYRRCKIIHSINTGDHFKFTLNATLNRLTFIETYFEERASGSGSPLIIESGTGDMRGDLFAFYGCFFKGQDNAQFQFGREQAIFYKCIFDNLADPMFVDTNDSATNTGNLILLDSTFHDCGKVEMARYSGIGSAYLNNIFNDPKTYAVEGKGPSDYGAVGLAIMDWNTIFNAGSGATLNMTRGGNGTDSDPAFVAEGSQDFAIGPALKAKGFPDSTADIHGTTTASFVDPGAAQREEPAASAPSIIRPVEPPY